MVDRLIAAGLVDRQLNPESAAKNAGGPPRRGR
jgi:hypothetical protein